MIGAWYHHAVGFWADLFGDGERRNAGRHSKGGQRQAVGRGRTRAKYGTATKPTNTRRQLAERAPRPNVRQKSPNGDARANVSARQPREGESFATQIKRQPANLWWGSRRQ